MHPEPKFPECDVSASGQNLQEAVLNAARYALQVPDDLDFNAAFKDLGGNSISAAILLARLWETTGIRLPLSMLTGSTSLQDLCNELSRRLAESAPH